MTNRNQTLDRWRDLPEMPRPTLLRRLAEKRSPRRVKVSLSLRFYAEVLKLDHLHYGLWQGEELDIDGLRSAQQRYSDTLAAWIPDRVERLLDVGSGIGTFARMLKGRGYHVEGLSPDPYQKRAFESRVGSPFHLVRFQEFTPPRSYDLVLMSESVQYIWLDRLFPAVRRAVPEGYLLLADYFRVPIDGATAPGSGHELAAFIEAAARAGLVLEELRDITEETLPTLDLARKWLEEYIDPATELLVDAARARYPRLLSIARKLLRKRLQKFEEDRLLVDSEHFRKTRRYLMMRYRIG